MHCEANFSKNILKTVTGHKDTVKVRRDLQRRGIRPHLWLIPHPRKNGKMLKPAAPYVLTSEEFEVFAGVIDPEDTIRTCFEHGSVRTEEDVQGFKVA
jgi:hypothetical protein